MDIARAADGAGIAEARRDGVDSLQDVAFDIRRLGVRLTRAEGLRRQNRSAPGAKVLSRDGLAGDLAQRLDWNTQMGSSIVPVILFVMGITFVLMLISFGSLVIAATSRLASRVTFHEISLKKVPHQRIDHASGGSRMKL